MKRYLILLLISLFIAQVSFAAICHTDYTNGNDTTGNGSSGTPYKTLQKCVNVSTGGDTINIANTSAQVLSASISWSSGWTADNTKYTTIQAWDNGGSIAIQRPDEATERVGAIINGNSAVNEPFSSSSHPSRLILKNIKFTGSTIWLMRLHGAGSTIDGCEIYGTTALLPLGAESSGHSILNTYIHDTTSSGNPIAYINDAIFSNNFLKNNSPASGFAVVAQNGSFRTIADHNIIYVPTGRVGFLSNSQNIIVASNTFISAGGTNSVGLQIVNNSIESSVYNNLFYNFDGSGDVPLDFGNSSYAQILGHNAYFDCNSSDTPTRIGLDNTAFDIIESGDPFTDLAESDLSLNSESAARGAGLANPNSSIDIGAVQSGSSSGTSSNNFFIISD